MKFNGCWKRLGRMKVWGLALLLVVAAGCAQFAAISESMFLMTPDQEKELGSQLTTELQKSIKPVNDAQLLAYVNQVGTRVVRAAPASELPIVWHVIQDKEINAFAIPGGGIYLNTGFLLAAEDEAEIAGVMAHEAGHVIMRHSAKQVSQQQGAQLIQQILLGTEMGQNQLAQMATTIVSQGATARYSRQDESEADAVAVKTLYRAGYDPMGMYTFFKKLEDRYGSSGSGLATMFASHPPTAERMNNVKMMVAQLPKNDAERPVTGLRKAQARLKSLGLQ